MSSQTRLVRHRWGTSSSPVLHCDQLYLVADNEEKSFLAAGYVGDKQTPNKPVYVVRPGGEGDLRTLSHVYCVKARAP